jgi:hypothetical protein
LHILELAISAYYVDAALRNHQFTVSFWPAFDDFAQIVASARSIAHLLIVSQLTPSLNLSLPG